MTRCFWLELTGQSAVTLRRYHRSEEQPCPSKWGYHNASSAEIARAATVLEDDPERPHGPLDVTRERVEQPPHDDPRWPAHCECGYAFSEDDEWQVNADRIYRADTGDEHTLRTAPPGAMWDAWWMPDRMKGQDGRCLVVRLPDGHDWIVDNESSNCTRKGEDHDCWCRHGEPPDVTVDKNPEPGRSTCQAGGGSIATKNWHGFLRGGQLVT